MRLLGPYANPGHFAGLNAPGMFNCNAVAGGEDFWALDRGLDHQVLFVREFSATASDTDSRAPLPGTIGIVFRERPKKQVIRSDADWIVALVQDAQSPRDWPLVHYPRCPVGSDCFSAKREVAIAFQPQFRASPLPAPVPAHKNVWPESFSGRLPWHLESLCDCL